MERAAGPGVARDAPTPVHVSGELVGYSLGALLGAALLVTLASVGALSPTSGLSSATVASLSCIAWVMASVVGLLITRGMRQTLFTNGELPPIQGRLVSSRLTATLRAIHVAVSLGVLTATLSLLGRLPASSSGFGFSASVAVLVAGVVSGVALAGAVVCASAALRLRHYETLTGGRVVRPQTLLLGPRSLHVLVADHSRPEAP